MITRPSSTTELTQLMSEIFLNRQNKVTKISDESVVNAIFYAVAKVAQKAEKDIAITESRLFPDNAYGEYLDNIAKTFGIDSRKGASGSSAYIRLFAVEGTEYLKTENTFSGNSGVIFELSEDVIVGPTGIAYAKVRSQDVGSKTNIDPFGISNVNPAPTGHQSVLNEYAAIGGRDLEQDELFRQRIKNNPNIVSKSTISQLIQLYQTINSNVLDVVKEGIGDDGRLVLALVPQNGADFSQTELADILEQSADYVSITDLKQFGESFEIKLKNIDWETIDIDFRIDLLDNTDPDIVRKNIQVALNKLVDFRFWSVTKKVEHTDLLTIIKNIDGVSYVPEMFFTPKTDLSISETRLPRFRGFIMRDMEGNVISDSNNVLNPIFYPNK